MALTVNEVKHAKPAERRRKLYDGGGLHVEISPKGVKTWKLDYRFKKKAKTITKGQWPDVSLADAREWRTDVKRQLKAGEDPSVQIRVAKKERVIGAPTFKDVGEEWLAKQTDRWDERYAGWVRRRFDLDIYPTLGDLAIGEIEHKDILKLIDYFEAKGTTEIARKVMQKVSGVMTYAVATARAKTNPVTDTRGAMSPRKKTRHFARLPTRLLPEFYGRLEASGCDRLTKLAIRWTILTMVRTNETRFFRIEEIENRGTKDLLWRIPAERMKMDREHLVPLPVQAEALIDEIDKIRKASESDWMFPQIYNAEKPMSENAMLYALYRLGYKGVATMHGFRSVASTLLNEQTNADETRMFHEDWVEKQLAHDEDDDSRDAYNAAEYLRPRRRMLQWWADYLADQEALNDLL